MCRMLLLLLQQPIRDCSTGQQGPSPHVSFKLLSFSKYVRTCNPGLHYVNPVTEEMVIVDCRISVATLPSQRLMTRGNALLTKTTYPSLSIPASTTTLAIRI
jgi:hypothetical protein